MSSDIDISGYVFTHEEWLDLEDEVRTELLDNQSPSMESRSATQQASLEA